MEVCTHFEGGIAHITDILQEPFAMPLSRYYYGCNVYLPPRSFLVAQETPEREKEKNSYQVSDQLRVERDALTKMKKELEAQLALLKVLTHPHTSC